MAKPQSPHLRSTNRISNPEPGEQASPRPCKDQLQGEGASEARGPSALLICAYLLGLASIAVVVIGGQFPWFTLAPAMVLLMAAHVRHLEAKFRRESPSQP
jgi:hypothetical protein